MKWRFIEQNRKNSHGIDGSVRGNGGSMRGSGSSACGSGNSAREIGNSALLDDNSHSVQGRFIDNSLPFSLSPMRPLTFAQSRTPAQQAEADEALRWLEQQPVPAGCPTEVYAKTLAPNFRFILSLAAQYQNRGLSLAELVAAGHSAAVTSIIRHDERPEELARWWAWWVRHGVLAAVEKQRNK